MPSGMIARELGGMVVGPWLYLKPGEISDGWQIIRPLCQPEHDRGNQTNIGSQTLR